MFGLVFLAQAQQTIPATGGDGLSNGEFWSLNQYSKIEAWMYFMSDNTPSPDSKNSKNVAVRAVRSF